MWGTCPIYLKTLNILPLICDNSSNGRFMSILCFQNSSRIIQNLQYIVCNLVCGANITNMMFGYRAVLLNYIKKQHIWIFARKKVVWEISSWEMLVLYKPVSNISVSLGRRKYKKIKYTINVTIYNKYKNYRKYKIL